MFGSFAGNLVGTLYFLVFQTVGISLVFSIFKEEKPAVRLLLGSTLGSVLLHWFPVLFSFFLGFTIQSHIIALLAVILISVFLLRKQPMDTTGWRNILVHCQNHKPFLIASAVLFMLWVCLLYSHILPISDAGGLYTGQSTYGDMNMHLAFITSIAKQGSFPPEYSLFPGTKLSYPFLSASISSSIYLMGASLQYAYRLPMLTAFMQILGSVYLLSYTVLKNRRKALLAYLFFFLNGGLGFVYFIDRNQNTPFSFRDIFTGYYTTPTNLVDYNIRWVNVIADMFLPQRATLFGYAALFPTIWLLHQAVFAGKSRPKHFLIAGILTSSLPMIHTHSFLGMGLVSGAWMLTDLYRRTQNSKASPAKRWNGGYFLAFFVLIMCLIQVLNQKVLTQDHLFTLGLILFLGCGVYGVYLLFCCAKAGALSQLLYSWGIYIGCIAVLALPQLLFWTLGQVSEGGFLRGHFNWGNQGDFYPWFYIKNLGAVCLLSVGAICSGRKGTRHLMLPVCIIWTISELIVFTPNTYDNNKLLYIGYLFLCLLAADHAVEIYTRLQEIEGKTVIAAGVFVISFLAAGLTLGREVISRYQIYDSAQVRLARYIEENTDVTDVFLTDTRHNNEVASLTGRNVVCGADLFLYFHGIDTAQRKEHVRAMYEDPKNHQDLFEQYNVSYVVISPWERSNYQLDETLWSQEYEQAFSYENTILYRIP